MDFDKYLKVNCYNWKDLILFAIEENKSVSYIIDGMVEDGLLDWISPDTRLELIDFLYDKLRGAGCHVL